MLLSKATLTIMVTVTPLLLAGFNMLAVFSHVGDIDDKIVRITVSIDILKSIVSPIVNEFGEVHSIVSGEVDPHSFTLTPEAVNIARGSDLLIITGHMKWEEDLVSQIAEEKGVSADSISINILNLDGIRILDINGDKNIHGFWLLPDNALIIAEKVKEKLSALRFELAEKLSENYERFRRKVSNLKVFLRNLSDKYGSHNRSVVTGFYAEQYIAEAMGLRVDSVLIGEEGTVLPESLKNIYEGCESGRYVCLIVSDTALLMEGVRGALEKISKETGCSIAYVLVTSANGLENYDAIMYYNAGQVYSALLAKHKAISNGTNIIYLFLITVLLLVIIFETILLVRGRFRL